MGMHQIGRYLQLFEEVKTPDDLALAMADICAKLGFQYFAITHHVDLWRAPSPAIRLHNYPAEWADYYDGEGLGVSDPVHRASHVTSIGFPWARIDGMIPLTSADRRLLDLGRDKGIGDGFTVPANVPGEARGSCSFANSASRPLPEPMLPVAQLVGAFAFEHARRLWSVRKLDDAAEKQALTDRQRDCVLWAARGKGDWEIGRILGVSEETVARHIKLSCERYGVYKRILLPSRTLLDGTLTFSDIFPSGR